LNTEPTESHYEKLVSIINVLGDPETLKILDKAKAGFESGKVTVREFKMTSRKYYRSLRKLNDADLIMHFEKGYKLTSKGEFLHKLLFNDVSTYLFADQSLLDPLRMVGNRTELSLVDNYKDLTKVVETAIEKSKSEILLATRYLDMAVVQSIMFAVQRGIKIKTITSEKVDFSGFIKLLGGFVKSFRPNTFRFLVGGESNFRSGDIPLSFMIIDGKIAIFEIPNKEFKVAFVSIDKEVVKILSHLFHEIWSRSRTLHIQSQ